MSLPITQAAHPLTEQQVEYLQSEDAYLRGEAALEILVDSAGMTGVDIPLDYVWPKVDRAVAERTMVHMFGMLGGMPGFYAFAKSEPKIFYKAWMDMAKRQEAVTATATAITIQSNIPSSPLDDVMLRPEEDYSYEAELKGDDDDI